MITPPECLHCAITDAIKEWRKAHVGAHADADAAPDKARPGRGYH